MHPRVKFDVYGPPRDALLAGCLHQGVEQAEGIDLRLQVVVEHRLEGGHLGVHHHDVGRDACTAQGHALVGYGNSQIIYAMIL